MMALAELTSKETTYLRACMGLLLLMITIEIPIYC